MNADPLRAGQGGEEDPWESLAEDLLGINLGANPAADSLISPEDISLDEPESPSSSAKPSAAKDVPPERERGPAPKPAEKGREAGEKRHAESRSAASQSSWADEEDFGADLDLEEAPEEKSEAEEETRTPTANDESEHESDSASPSDGEEATSAAESDTYWDTLKDWRWDESDDDSGVRREHRDRGDRPQRDRGGERSGGRRSRERGPRERSGRGEGRSRPPESRPPEGRREERPESPREHRPEGRREERPPTRRGSRPAERPPRREPPPRTVSKSEDESGFGAGLLDDDLSADTRDYSAEDRFEPPNREKVPRDDESEDRGDTANVEETSDEDAASTGERPPRRRRRRRRSRSRGGRGPGRAEEPEVIREGLQEPTEEDLSASEETGAEEAFGEEPVEEESI